MYTVQVDHECGCFQKSEYTGIKSFDTQQDAYNYTNIVAELMNEEFCGKHLFYPQKPDGQTFVIKVAENPNGGGSCSTGSCGPCGC